ncbi:transcription initiation factor TFIID subunit 4 isoform X2 [Schistocerca americana]|uniref:transcription initiation factor TFIID subunit 4 isoform X2 n=1 Tax=Schistocerca americana TaxID=7009 RepID=UPI001F4FF7A9|nr:transcription initiation factor TFIID subunit 4 isoform X2 [Schistocerca americana]XP_049784282.1 transcription initiation factor TFIID subunit 4 isoform X2 [Schistocerca cancellata]
MRRKSHSCCLIVFDFNRVNLEPILIARQVDLNKISKSVDVNSTRSSIHFLSYLKGNALWVRVVWCACAVQFTVGARQKMASAKFLEEALSTDVDESAVSAIVGTLETQLVTTQPAVSSQQGTSASVNQNHMNNTIANGGTVSTQKHGVTNGGPPSMNILNADANKTISSSTIQSSNVVHSSVVNTVVASLHGGVPTSGYLNQVTSSANQGNITNISKSHEPVKVVYPPGSQTNTSTVGININNRVNFPTTALPNGNLGLSPIPSHTVLNAVTSTVQSAVSQSHSQSGASVTGKISGVVSVDGKPGTALVIKASGNNNATQGTPISANLVTVPMTVNTTMALTGSYVNTAVGTTTGTTTGMSGVVTLTKPVTHSVGTSQTLVGNSPTILPANVQILNVNAVRLGTPGQQGQKSIPPRVVIGAPHMVGARPGQPGQITLQTLQGLQPGTQGHLLLKTENGQYQLLRMGPVPTTHSSTVTPNSGTATIPSGSTFRIQSVPAHGTVAVATTTAAAIQATPPPALTTQTATVQKSLPLLRQSLATKELVIDGIRPPPQSAVVFSLANSTMVPQVQTQQIRPQVATAQVRLMAPVNAATQSVGVTTVPRPGQPVQTHRIVAPVRPQTPVTRMITTTALRPQSPVTTATTTLPSTITTQIRVPTPTLPTPPLHIRQPVQVQTKTPTAIQLRPPPPVQIKAAIPHIKPQTNAFVKPPTPSLLPKPVAKEKEKKSFSSAGYTGDDDINDVAAMGGVNLAEETQRILGSTEFVGTQIRSCKDEIFLHAAPLQQRIRQIVARHGLTEEPSPEVAALISHATQERLKNLIEKLSIIAEHRIDVIKMDPRYEVTQDVKGQLKFLEELDRVERKRHEEHERELLLRAAKSRSKSEDPEQAKLKAKAKEMQRAEMEELRQREANLTALQAIGPRKKPRLELGTGVGNSSQGGAGSSNGAGSSLNRTQLPMRPRLKRVNLRDLLFLLEQEKETCRSTLLYKSFLK